MGLFNRFFAKPFSKQLTVTSGNGFHLRPIAQFASLAKTYPCSISAYAQERTADVKSVPALLALALDKGDSFTLETKGKNAQDALEALDTLFTQLMVNDQEHKEVEKATTSYQGTTLQGHSIYSGIAISDTCHYKVETFERESNIAFQEALDLSVQELEEAHKSDASGIYLAQKELLLSLGETHKSLETFETKITFESKQLLGTKLESKRADYLDILQRIKKHMGLEVRVSFPDAPFILVADDLLPSEIDLLVKSQAEGVILKKGSLGGHSAILLRAAGIPSLLINTELLEENEKIILDSYAGVVVYHPSQEDIQQARSLQKNKYEMREKSASKRFEPAVTQEGKEITVLANITDVNSAKQAKNEGANGVGLFRTEFLFTDEKPDFGMQVNAYKEVFEMFESTTIRTLDVGGDKALPYINIDKEMNPFLGIRGIRLYKTHPEVMREQLLAILTAAQDRNVKIMFPMVSALSEFIEVKSLAKSLAKEHLLSLDTIKFGIMIEVPSVLYLLDAFNEEVDFYSIGTNDLTQYLFAIERTHPTLMVDPHTSVLYDVIKDILQKADKPVSICGELAADGKAIPKLIKLGVETLSVSAKNIPQTKEEIRHV